LWAGRDWFGDAGFVLCDDLRQSTLPSGDRLTHFVRAEMAIVDISDRAYEAVRLIFDAAEFVIDQTLDDMRALSDRQDWC
jgi:hypothetical protein